MWIVLLCVRGATAAEFHVAPTAGPAGDGSMGNPWQLEKALSHPPEVNPGDTIWVHGGNYVGNFTSVLRGSIARPIIVRNFGHERATILSQSPVDAMSIVGAYSWYWGLEITSTTTDTVTDGGDGIRNAGVGNKIINCIIHDHPSTGIADQNSIETELYGNVIYFNGRRRGGGNYAYGVYGQSSTGQKYYSDNMFIHNFGAYQIHLYAENNAIDSFRVTHNVLTSYVQSATFLVGGGTHSGRGEIIDSNFTFGSEKPSIGILQPAFLEFGPLDSPVIRGNFFIRGQMLLNPGTSNRVLVGNTSYGEDPYIINTGQLDTTLTPGNTWYTSNWHLTPPRPSGVWRFVRQNKYERQRANIVIYNWDGLQSVPVDVSDVMQDGDKYVVLDAQDFFGSPVTSGISQGGSIQVPMNNLSIARPVTYPGELGLPEHTSLTFGSFVLMDTPLVAATHDNPFRQPKSFNLEQNYPNPFNASTRIEFDVPIQAQVTLEVFDALGRRVTTLINGILTPDHYSVSFDGSALASGVYYYRLTNPELSLVRLLVLLK